LLGEERNRGKRWLEPKWSKLAEEDTRTVIMSNSDGNGAFVSVVPDKRFHFITAAGL
jgi:hypothetical protein